VDLKLSGEWYAEGLYLWNPQMVNYGASNPQSAALVFTRTRLAPELTISEGLYFNMRMDALEKTWGDRTWSGYGTNGYSETQARPQNAINGDPTLAQENIEIQRAWVTAVTPIGAFLVGYQPWSLWGTSFGDTDRSVPGITYEAQLGPLTLAAAWGRYIEGQRMQNFGGLYNGIDTDADEYDLGGIYKFEGGEVGLLYQYFTVATFRQVPGAAFSQNIHVLDPYVKFAKGPLYLEAEFIWGFGNFSNFEEGNLSGQPNVKISSIGGYLNAKVNMGPAYVGGMFAYAQGDDPTSTDKLEGGLSKWLQAGDDFNPCLILWNSDYTTQIGNIVGNTSSGANFYSNFFQFNSPYDNSVTTYFDNAWLWQGYVGIKPIPKLELKAAFTYAYADQKPTVDRSVAPGSATEGGTNSYFVGKDYGRELDVTAKYKIFDNLSYTVGVAYLWTGDYFKGTDASVDLKDNYLVMNKLQLNF
ncbi:MAG: hypothetical protein ABSB79_14985, partial [Syntrophales bacterium]